MRYFSANGCTYRTLKLSMHMSSLTHYVWKAIYITHQARRPQQYGASLTRRNETFRSTVDLSY